jgi:subtilisin family serine protease
VANGEGIAGFGGDARLLVVRIGAPEGVFTDVDSANAIVYAVRQGARVINLSFGGSDTSATELAAIDYAAAQGALVVAAAGNEFQRGNPVTYPAAFLQPPGSNGAGGKGLAVAASTVSGARAPFSNTGSYLSLAAPGESVLGALSSSASTRASSRSRSRARSPGCTATAAGPRSRRPRWRAPQRSSGPRTPRSAPQRSRRS